ncbi:MAG: polyphosphate kinase [Pseudomonadota bacterium]|nr:polyphosphate kinase [Pseudomonadota bacterium]
MPVDLTQFERGDPLGGDDSVSLAELQARLAQLQIAQIAHRQRSLIIFEGWTGSGKRDALKLLAASWDPCHLSTRCVGGGESDDDERHWLAPFWSALPPAGDTTIFYRSWYSRLIDDRAAGRMEAKRWTRACDEINEFEAQQRDHGTLIVKLFFHISADTQQQRMRERLADPWRRHLIEAEPPPARDNRESTICALHDMFAQTDTRWAPWRVIDANDQQAARIATLTILAEAFAKAMPSEPPALDETIIAFPHQKSAQASG